MSPSNYDFKTALVTGGGGGIGKALSHQLIQDGKKVIIAGRTEFKLQESAEEIGAAAYYASTPDVTSIPPFVQTLTKHHPDLDCVINNAGVQRPLNVNDQKPDAFLSKADQEIDINIRGPMHLTLHLLPHLQSHPSALIVNVSSVLGFVPFSVINPVYCGTKASCTFGRWIYARSFSTRASGSWSLRRRPWRRICIARGRGGWE